MANREVKCNSLLDISSQTPYSEYTGILMNPITAFISALILLTSVIGWSQRSYLYYIAPFLSIPKVHAVPGQLNISGTSTSNTIIMPSEIWSSDTTLGLGASLQTNGSFENWTTGNPDGFTKSGAGTVTQVTDGVDQTSAIEFNATTNTYEMSSSYIPVLPSASYTMTSWVKEITSDAEQSIWGLDIYDSTPTRITAGATNCGGYSAGFLAWYRYTNDTTSWSQASFPCTMPSNAAYVKIKIGTWTPAANAHRFDNISFHADNSPVTINVSGNVGIGTTNPGYRLESANGDSDQAKIGSALMGGWENGNAYARFGHSSMTTTNYALLQHSGGATYVNSGSGTPIYFRIGNTQEMILDTNGNLGIGTTAPARLVEVNDANPLIKFDGDPTGEDHTIGLDASGFVVYNDTDSRYDMVISNTGNVGIGITAPVSQLEINGTSRVTGSSTPTSGEGLESYYFSNAGYIISYNRGTSAYNPLNLNGSYINLQSSSTGNVGIGTASPGQKLDIAGNLSLSGGDRVIETPGGYIDLTPTDATYGLILRDYTGGTAIWSSFRTVNDTTDFLHITMNSTTLTEGIVVSDSGNVGIGNTAPASKLEVNGEITQDTITQVGADPMCWDGSGASKLGDCTSLKKYKTNLSDLSLGLDTILKLTPREFTWTKDMGGKHDLGFVAEEVETVNPLLVTYHDQLSGVKYMQMSALLTKAIQEQQTQISNLSTKLNTQQEQIDELKQEIQSIKSQLP